MSTRWRAADGGSSTGGRIDGPADQRDGITNADRSALRDIGVERESAAESAADVAQYFRITVQRVGIDVGHHTAAAQRDEADDRVADVQFPAWPAH